MIAIEELRKDEKNYALRLIEEIVDRCPRRAPASEDEKKCQMMLKEQFECLGLPAEFQDFRFGPHLYANIALHFGLGTLGTVVSGLAPALGLALHATAAGSYWAESTRKAYVLRRLLGFKPSQNLLATMPAENGKPKLRLVFLAHADAAYTGLIFSPAVVKMNAKTTAPWLKRSMTLATQTTAALTFFDALRMAYGPLTLPLRPIEYALTVPAFLAFVLNMEVVLRNRIVPGANDDLSGVAALPVLAKRLGAKKPKDVEIVFGVTGCEEASLGGADALARAMDKIWDKENTVIIGLDGLTNGDLQYFEIEGEIIRTPIPGWLKDILEDTAASESRFRNEVKGFEIPVGGSDVAAFLAHGWNGVCLGCVDPALGSPRHYHQPGDTPEHLDMDKLLYSIDFTEKLALAVMEKRR